MFTNGYTICNYCGEYVHATPGLCELCGQVFHPTDAKVEPAPELVAA